MSEISAAPVVATPVAAPPPNAAEPAAPEVAAGAGEPGDDADPVAEARRKARELLFNGVEAEVDEHGEPVEVKPEPKPEAKTEPEAKPAEKDGDEVALSKKWAKFRAQETRLVERQKAHAAEQKAFESKTKEFAAREAKLAEREAQMNDPIAFMQSAGWDKDRIVQWIQGDGKVDPEILVKQLSDRHQKEMEELRAERERERNELQTEKQNREFQRLGAELDRETSAMLQEADFPLLQRFTAKKGEQGVQKRVKDIIAAVWREKQTVVDPREALAYLERELAEVQLSDSPGQVPAARPANPAAVEPKPITNQATAQRTVVPQEDDDNLDGWRARARKIMRGEIQADE